MSAIPDDIMKTARQFLAEQADQSPGTDASGIRAGSWDHLAAIKAIAAALLAERERVETICHQLIEALDRIATGTPTSMNTATASEAWAACRAIAKTAIDAAKSAGLPGTEEQS